MRKDVLLIFDIGKTNKKILLFDRQLRIVHEEEHIFEEIIDDDGFHGDDIEKIERWVRDSCVSYLEDPDYHVLGINFTTYGASILYLDSQGNRLTPLYNYLKPMPEGVVDPVYKTHGGKDEFCRNTASPAMGMLNYGFQALWLKTVKPDIYDQVHTILNFPQYLSYLLTGRTSMEHTYIGCHSATWDFDNMKYHEWIRDLGDVLTEPLPVETTFPAREINNTVPVGIGLHDSSASLVPYLLQSGDEFILVSTGTWCISMNPFNHSPLTPDQMAKGCLAYLSTQRKPVKSSMLFLGHIHDVNVRRLARAFQTDDKAYKQVALNEKWFTRAYSDGGRVFFSRGIPADYVDNTVDPARFNDFAEAYHQLMADLVDLAVASINLIIDENDRTGSIYITGGFSRNPIFLRGISAKFPGKKILTSDIPNATSLGAALVLWKAIEPGELPDIDLGLK